jgi:geranylgeranyl diphosphate synthase type I
MRSAVKPDNLAAVLTAALGRFDGTSPVTEQVRYHFAHGDPARIDEAQPWMELVLAVAQHCGAAPDDALDVACAVAILHNFALVHADVGVETGASVPARYGLAHGINAGDALCALAYLQVLAAPAIARPPERTVALARALLEGNYAMCAGTSGALLGAACELGALAAGIPTGRARTFGRLGRSYGAAAPSRVDVARLCAEAGSV